MRYLVVAVVAAGLFAVPANAADTGRVVAAPGAASIADFLGHCGAKDSACLATIAQILGESRSAREVCLPADVTPDDAAKRVLAWMRTGASASGNNGSFTNYPAAVGMRTAFAAFWPCPNS